MCEPKAGIGLMLADLAVGTKAGRGLLATAIVGGGLYLSTQIMVTLPLIVPVALGAVAIAAIVAAGLYRQQSKANAAVANATRQPARIEVQRVSELEATRPVLDAVPVVTVREDA